VVQPLLPGGGNGAIFVDHDAALMVDGGTFTGNIAKDGGALEDQSAGGAQVDGATFIANTATEFGGTIDFDGEEDGGVQGSVFIGNKAAAGGAIAAGSPGVSGSTFIHNSAEQGGALYLNAGVEPPVLSDIVVRDNTASGDGGGIYTYSLDISGSQITGNHSAATEAVSSTRARLRAGARHRLPGQQRTRRRRPLQRRKFRQH
jgi:predicted outer membrane repeat protein